MAKSSMFDHNITDRCPEGGRAMQGSPQSALELFRLDGRVAIVNGGGGAIGSALGEALASAGARVVLAGRTGERLDVAADRIRSAGGEALPIEADVTEEAASQAVVDQAVERLGRVDIVVNAVGGGAGDALYPAEAYPRVAWDWIMELNLRSTVVPTQPAVRWMIEHERHGAVLNVTSVRANLGIRAGYSAYVAAKGAVSSLTRQWATEWARHGIRANAIMPTFVDTPQVASLLADPDFRAGIVSRIPIGRVGETRDLIGPAIFLVSDAASFVTGHVLAIDGGLTAAQ
jgi:gluconate 5-dehydrogenase